VILIINTQQGMNMRVKIFGVEMTIPNRLLLKLDTLDFDELSDKEKKLYDALVVLIAEAETIDNSSRVENAEKATTAKINKSKEKIQNAINLLRLQGEEINPYRIAKLANVSYNTARKYFKSYYDTNNK
jgi:Fic family protein